ncbi:MAG: hypothetical protein JW841_11700 [Deltaproteobacteria bacterium]|nr:hypothetical protein [Deltaproteobacteria bacterium]
MLIEESQIEVLQPLLDLLNSAEPTRLVAYAGSVSIDRPQGTAPAMIVWDEAQHNAALANIGTRTLRLANGVIATTMNEVLLLHAPARADRRSDDLVRDGYISSLAARTLSATLAIGRNVLIIGPYLGSLQLLMALAADGKRPMVIGGDYDAVPITWPHSNDANAITCYGADRIASWSLPPTQLINLLSKHCGVIAWLEARNLSKALMRFEAALDHNHATPAPLQVLTAIDMVVVVNDIPNTKVVEVAEIALVESGYQPRLLFSTGIAPLPSALVPMAPPSFIAEIAQAGFAVLADELHNASASQVAANASIAPSISNVSPPILPKDPLADSSIVSDSVIINENAGILTDLSTSNNTAKILRDRLQQKAAQIRAAEQASLAQPSDDSAPGWELDRLPDETNELPSDQSEFVSSSAEDAMMAATYGLGPPPRPTNVREDRRPFEDALRHAKERDEENREE